MRVGRDATGVATTRAALSRLDDGLPGYDIIGPLARNSTGLLFRAVRSASDRHPGDSQAELLVRVPFDPERVRDLGELFAAAAGIEGVAHPADDLSARHPDLVLLENAAGEPLAQVVRARALAPDEFVVVGAEMARIVARLHSLGLLHKDLQPDSFLWDATTGRLTLTDLGLATRIRQERAPAANPEVIEGSLAYISPEQTGRMNRVLDYRTDLYSLGVCFFEMLTGRVPFDDPQPLRVVHAHMASRPPRVDEVVPGTPEILADIVDNLLEKNAEDRYQSADGLAADLDACRRLYEMSGRIRPFRLKKNDSSALLRLPGKLYGRDGVVHRLTELFDEAAAGPAQFVFVAGYSGVGKTAFVREVHRPITARRGHVAEGKFEALHASTPYSGWISAITGLVHYLLMENETELERWRGRLRAAIDQNGAVLASAIPDLRLVIGDQPDVRDLPPLDMQNRFGRVFGDLVRALASPENPLVIFLDDLQWADRPSLSLLESLAFDPGLRNVLIIGAYRDNEVTPDHPLAGLIGKCRNLARPAEVIELRPLNVHDVARMLADTLHCAQAQVHELALLVHLKTGGNPLYIGQLLEALVQGGLLVHEGQWNWDIDAVRRAPVGEDIADLLAAKVAGLPAATLGALKIAACIGAEFDLGLLARVDGKTPESEALVLEAARNAGLIEFSGLAGQFVHDRILEAAAGLMSQPERARVHHAVARALVDRAPDSWPDELVFRVAEQINQAGDQLAADERPMALDANLLAGRRARASAAFAAAPPFFARAAALLPDDAWETDHVGTMAIYADWAEAAYAAVDLERAEELFAVVLEHATDLAERLPVLRKQIDFYKTSMRFGEALATVASALAEAGVPMLPIGEIDEVATAAQLGRVKELLGQRHPIDLVALPVAAAPYSDAMELIADAGVLMWLGFPHAAAYCAALGVNTALEHGPCGGTTQSLALLGALMCVQGRHELGVSLGEAALALEERFAESANHGMTQLLYHSFVGYWSTPLRTAIEPLRIAYGRTVATGDNLTAAYLINNLLGPYLFAGLPLETARAAWDEMEVPFFRLRQPNAYVAFNVIRQTVHCLAGTTEDSAVLEGRYWSESRDMEELVRLEFLAAIGVVGTCKLAVLVFAGRFREAAAYYDSPGTAAAIAATQGLYPGYPSLAIAAIGLLRDLNDVDEETRSRRLEQVEQIGARLDAAALAYAPNFAHLSNLVAAERARVAGDAWTAARLYREAIAAARLHEFTHFEALANELAGRFWLDQSCEEYAKPHLAEAVDAYRRWGARPAVERLVHEFPWLSVRHADGGGEPLSLHGVLMASQAISSEIELDPLLARLLEIAAETAGAQRSILILRDASGQLTVEARVGEDGTVPLVRSTLLDEVSDLPQSIVWYVARTGETVLLDDAWAQGEFTQDAVIQDRKVRSVLCVPISMRGTVIGILYLENAIATAAFGSHHVEILEMLSGQAAISLVNARLYADRERTAKALGESEEKFRTLVENTADVVFSMDTEGRFTYVSPAVKRMPWGEEDFVGSHFAKFLHPDDLDRAVASFHQAASGNGVPSEFRGLGHDGTIFFLRVAARPQYEDGRVCGLIGTLTDVSEHRALEQQLLQAMKMDSIGRLAGGVAHDFNNLLTIILGNAELANLEVAHGTPAGEAVEEIIKAGHRASSLTRQLLAFASKQIVAPVRLNLSTIVADSSRMLTRLLDGIEIETQLEPHLLPIEADPGQIEQLLLNLTVNAKDAMPGGGRLYVETRNEIVRPNATSVPSEVPPGRYAVLTVTDTGHGMSPEVLAHIFEPFYTTKSPGKGTGLGLATCHGIVKQNHGHIFVFSEIGLGSTFRIMLPVARADAPAAAGEISAPASIEGTETVLVVEDEESVRRLAVLGLRAHGYNVVDAHDGPAALDLAADPSVRFDIVVSDVIMPGVGGPELTRRLASMRPGVPVILVSGHAEQSVLDGDGRGSSFSFLQKPFTPEGLAKRVREILDARP